MNDQDSDRGDGTAPARGLGQASRAVGQHLAALASARLELASIEWVHERERIQWRLGRLLAGLLLLVLGVFTLAGLMILYFWESHRMAALLVTGVSFSALGVFLIQWPGTDAADGGLPFAATRAEFDKDRWAFFGDDTQRTGEPAVNQVADSNIDPQTPT